MNRHNQPIQPVIGDPIVTPEEACPCCGYKMNRLSGIGHDNKPEPGSLTICMYCSEVLILGPDLKMVKPTESELAEIKSLSVWNQLQHIQYALQITWLHNRMVDWQKANPGVEALIHFKNRPDTAVICTVKQAIDNDFLNCNKPGMDMLTAMGCFEDSDREPTLFMLSAAMEEL